MHQRADMLAEVIIILCLLLRPIIIISVVLIIMDIIIVLVIRVETVQIDHAHVLDVHRLDLNDTQLIQSSTQVIVHDLAPNHTINPIIGIYPDHVHGLFSLLSLFLLFCLLLI